MHIRDIDLDYDMLRSKLSLVIYNSTASTIYDLRNETRVNDFLKEFMNNEEVIKLMIFNNDRFKIAPIHTLMEYYAESEMIKELNNFEKRNIGSAVTHLFISVLGYQNSYRQSRKYCQVNVGQYFYNEEE